MTTTEKPHPTRTDQTIVRYRARGDELIRQSGARSISDLVAWFLAQDRVWARSTVRQYRAAIRQKIADNAAHDSEREQLLTLLKLGPHARRKNEPARTSARKRKVLPFAEYVLLVQTLRASHKPDDDLAAEFLRHNCVLYLRTCEYQTARVVGKRLIVQNAKNTNGRSFGPTRTIRLHDYGEEHVESLRTLLRRLKIRAKEVQGFDRLWPRLATRIARACKKANIRRVALYTSRHVGMANAKAWLSPEQVAAGAGHKTTGTSQLHYAKRRSGWGRNIRCVCLPDEVDVLQVVRSARTDRPRMLAERRAKREKMLDPAKAKFRDLASTERARAASITVGQIDQQNFEAKAVPRPGADNAMFQQRQPSVPKRRATGFHVDGHVPNKNSLQPRPVVDPAKSKIQHPGTPAARREVMEEQSHASRGHQNTPVFARKPKTEIANAVIRNESSSRQQPDHSAAKNCPPPEAFEQPESETEAPPTFGM